MIEIEGLTKRFGAITAVDGLRLAIPRGELFGLVGPDGAGKTTTLRMLAGILTVAENLDFYADLFEVPKRERGARIERLLHASNLVPFTHRLADTLSGGMKQKLALACGLVHTPEIVLLDEPTNGVDPVSRRDFWRILYEMLKAGVTILLTTAYLDEAERCHRVGLMHQGRLLAVDTPQAVKRSLGGDLVEITVADAWRARQRLAGVPAARSVTLFGQRLHVAVDEMARDLPAVLAALGAAGFEPREPRRVVPSLEDVFIAMLERPPTAPASAARGS